MFSMIVSFRNFALMTALAVLMCIAGTGRGQSSLFTVPTTDVVEEKKLYVEADFDAHLDRLSKAGWQSYGFSAVYGASTRTEIGLNGYLIRTADGVEPVELQPNFKYKAFNNESKGVAVSFGAIGYLPVTKNGLRNSTASIYAVASKEVKGDYAPRVTGGVYQMIGALNGERDTRGYLVGIEQPVHKRVTIIGEWNSAKNRFGYAAAGLGITLTKRSYLWAAYCFGNERRANNSLGIYYGVDF